MLGIIIINYNTYEKTIDCVNSIRDTYDDYKIYLLDNASVNDSCKKLKNEFSNDSRIEMIFENENHGYARGNNLCLKRAKEDGCKYVIISNNDIVYKPGAIACLVDDISKHDAFLVGPKVIKPNGDIQGTVKYHRPTFIEYIKYETYIRNFFKKSYNNHVRIPEESKNVYWIAGCTFIVDIEKFEKIGFFDDYTFLYFEEFILSEKAKQNNYIERFCKDAEVLHYHGFSMGGSLNIVTRKANWRSESYFLKNYLHWNYLERLIIWKIRVLEIMFNARKEKNKKEIVDAYKEGKKYLVG